MIEDDNKSLESVCNDLFYGTTEFAGNIGIKNLAQVVGMSEENFQNLYSGATEDQGLSM